MKTIHEIKTYSEATSEARARLRDTAISLIWIVEGGSAVRWNSNGFRLKDTQEWAAFYVAANAFTRAELADAMEEPAQPSARAPAAQDAPEPTFAQIVAAHCESPLRDCINIEKLGELARAEVAKEHSAGSAGPACQKNNAVFATEKDAVAQEKSQSDGALAARLLRTLEAMANTPAYVGMELWNEHSNAVLEAARHLSATPKPADTLAADGLSAAREVIEQQTFASQATNEILALLKNSGSTPHYQITEIILNAASKINAAKEQQISARLKELENERAYHIEEIEHYKKRTAVSVAGWNRADEYGRLTRADFEDAHKKLLESTALERQLQDRLKEAQARVTELEERNDRLGKQLEEEARARRVAEEEAEVCYRETERARLASNDIRRGAKEAAEQAVAKERVRFAEMVWAYLPRKEFISDYDPIAQALINSIYELVDEARLANPASAEKGDL
jgi:hypothetical protein